MNKQTYIKKAEEIVRGMFVDKGFINGKSYYGIEEIAQALYQLHIEGVREIVKTWGAIPSTDDYAQGWNDARKEFARTLEQRQFLQEKIQCAECKEYFTKNKLEEHEYKNMQNSD